MSSLIIEEEYLFKLKLYFRKIIPKNNFFYILFFLVKFFPLILFTHSIEEEIPSEVFTLSKLIKSLTIINNLAINSYISVCIIIYILVIIIILLFLYIFFCFFVANRNTNYKLYEIPWNNIVISKKTHFIMKITTWIFIVTIFFYQHLIEVLYFGIFRYFASNKCFDMQIIENRIRNDKIDANYNHKFLIAILNIFFIICLALLMYGFIFLSSSQIIGPSYGYQSKNSIISNFLNVFYFSIQGVYTSKYFSQKLSESNVIICGVLLFILFFDLLESLRKQESYLNFFSSVPMVIRFIKSSCLFSGIFEIYLFYTSLAENRAKQRYHLVKLLIVLMMGIIITWTIGQIKLFLSFKSFAKNFFLKTGSSADDLVFYFRRLQHLKTISEKIMFIVKLLVEHQRTCNVKNCSCNKIQTMLRKGKKGKNFERALKKIMLLGEEKVSNMIMNRNKNNQKIETLLYLHCEFNFSIRKKPWVLLYLSQFYLRKYKKILGFNYSYRLYEMNYITYKSKVVEKVRKKERVYMKLLEANFENIKIQKQILLAISRIEQLIRLKSLQKLNVNTSISCEEFLKPMSKYIKENKDILRLIKKTSSNPIKSSHLFHSIKTKFIIYYYLKLFKVRITADLKDFLFLGNSVFPSYEEMYNNYLKENYINKIQQYVIVNLNTGNKFVTQYISTPLAEALLFTTKELVGYGLDEKLLPKTIASQHPMYIKEYVLHGFRSFQKRSFLLTKKHQLYPVLIKCLILPTLTQLYSLIVNVEEIKSEIYSKYYFILDNEFNIQYISDSFEDKYSINMKMINSLQIKFCEFFGFDKDDLTKFFFNDQGAEPGCPELPAGSEEDSEKTLPLAAPSYKSEEIVNFKKIKFKSGNELKVKDKIVEQEIIENYLVKLGRSVDDIGLEKEWKFLITLLYHQIKSRNYVVNEPILSSYKSNADCKKRNTNFYVQIALKKICNLCYFISTVTEEKDEKDELELSSDRLLNTKRNLSTFGDKFNEALKSGNLDDLFREKGYNTKEKRFSRLLSPSYNQSNVQTLGSNQFGITIMPSIPSSILTKTGTNTTKEEMSIVGNTSRSNFLVNSTENNLSSNLSRVADRLEPRKKKVVFVDRKRLLESKEGLTGDDKNKDVLVSVDRKEERNLQNLRILRSAELIISVIILLLTLINIIQTFSYIDYSLSVFSANLYSFLVMNHILFGALNCINYCFIQDNVQTGNITYISELILESGTRLVTDYNNFNSFITKLATKDGLESLYQAINEEDEYSSLLSNWKLRTYKSTFAEETYILHQFFKNFNFLKLRDSNRCRARDIFLNNKFLEYISNDYDIDNTTPTNNEKFIFYIMQNILTTMMNRIDRINTELSKIFQKNISESKISYFCMQLSSLLLGLILYTMLLSSVLRKRKVFKKWFKKILDDCDSENILYEDLKKFKELLNNFSIKDAQNYSSFKASIYTSNLTLGSLAAVSSMASQSFIARKNPNLLKNKDKNYQNFPLKTQEMQISFSPGTMRLNEKEGPNSKRLRINKKRSTFKAELKFILISLFSFVLVFLISIVIEIVNIVTNSNFFSQLHTGQLLSINIMWRFPKLNEILLYTYISAINNDPNFIAIPAERYNEKVFFNYYNYKIDTTRDTFYTTLGESNYAYLNYEFSLIRKNIAKLFADKKKAKSLKTTVFNGNNYSGNLKLCRHSNYVYYSTIDVPMNLIDFFKEVSSGTRTCRKVGNGLNLGGLKPTLNTMGEELNSLFLSFVRSSDKSRNIALVQKSNFMLILENNNHVIQKMNISNGKTIMMDIKALINEDKKIKIALFLLSICFSYGATLILLWLVDLELHKNNEILKNILIILKNFSSHLD